MNIANLIAGAVAATLSSTLPSESQTLFDVTGVGTDDTLSIRRDIEYVSTFRDAPVVGSIPPSAKGVESSGVTTTMANGSVWREIRYGDTTGWVNSRYLRRDYAVDWFSTKLTCSGTEPFWNLGLSGAKAEFSTMEGDLSAFELLDVLRAQGRSHVYETQWLAVSNDTPMSAVFIDTGTCSDGMSDLLSDVQVLLLGLEPGQGPVVGCCTFTLE